MDHEILFSIADELYDRGAHKKAFVKFLSLARLGHVASMERVAAMYGAGRGVEYNFENSIDWDLKAVGKGSITSCFNLGISYRSKGDMKRAKYWFEKAADTDDGEAALELGKMYMVSDLEADRIRSYLTSALKSNNICEESREEAALFLDELNNIVAATRTYPALA